MQVIAGVAKEIIFSNCLENMSIVKWGLQVGKNKKRKLVKGMLSLGGGYSLRVESTN